MMKANMNEMPGAGKPYVRLACAAVAAVVMAGLAPKTLAGDTLVTDLPVTSGLVYHFSAAAKYADSLVLDEDGCVTTWRDLSGNDNDFIAETETKTYSTARPKYLASDGPLSMPALQFIANDSQAGKYLRGQKTLTHGTLFLFSRPAYQTHLYANNMTQTKRQSSTYGTIYSKFEDYVDSIDFYENAPWCYSVYGDLKTNGSRIRIDGERRYAYDNGAQSFGDGYVDFRSLLGDDFNLATFVYGTAKSFQPMVGGGYIKYSRYYSGTVTEMALYSRQLTEAECWQVERAMLLRYFGNTWTGKAGDGKWSTAGNWSAGKVPDRRSYVVIGDATVAVEGDVTVGILEATGTTFDIAADGHLYAGRFAGSSGNTFATAAGATFGFNVFEKRTETVPGVVTGTGTFTKGGKGTLALTAGALAGTLKVVVDCGALDLDGLSPTFASLGGEGNVTNTSATAVTLTVDNADNAVLSARVAADIPVVKKGAGLLAVSPQELQGLTLEAGTVKTVTNLAYAASVTGVVVHLDASRRDTLTVDANGLVSAWRSLVGDNVVYFDEEGLEKIAYTATKPHYEPSIVTGGRPCVFFGANDNKSAAAFNLLMSSRTLAQKSYFFVLQPKTASTFTSYGKLYFGSSCGPYGEVMNFNHCPGSRWNVGNDAWNGYHYISGKWSTTDYTNAQGKVTTGAPYDLQYPHVYYSTTSDSEPRFDAALGGWYMSYWNTSKSTWARRGTHFTGAICELVVLDHVGTDEEREAITASLMTKWGIKFGAAQAFPAAFGETGVDVTVTGSATADFTAAGAKISSITVDAQNGTTVPCLTTVGEIVVTNTALAVVNSENVKTRGAILSSDTAVTGPFKSVTGLTTKQKLKYKAKEVIFRVLKGLKIMFR